ncbi:serine hydrolase domain-containing protein [Paenibacillus wulumuqiensis]|uniref:serine hydrolase domain-containing protein n=1 Tax=Paenibacillus wulumuqiensis TaxID=1567107 RepID=UPI0006960AF8|nr:serine hydrolase [Paenibacillus wulumuqiensis]
MSEKIPILISSNLLRPALPVDIARNPVIDEQQLRKTDERLEREYPRINSFLVAQSGQLVYESYYNGNTASNLADLRSATKSFTSVLVGIARQQGLFDNIDEPIEHYLADQFPAHPSAELRSTTIRHLLTMTAGFAWKTGKKLGEPDIHQFHRTRHWARAALRRPILPETRDVFQYRSIDTHLLSVLISRWSGQDAFSYARDTLFGSLGIEQAAWSPSPEGDSMGHVGLCLTPRDMLRFGVCCLQQGKWKEQQIIPADWLEQSFTPQSEGYAGYGYYGYGWWTGKQDGLDYACAHGHGGQEIIILPQLDTVIVFTSDSKVRKYKNPRHLLPEMLFPALQEAQEANGK